MKKTSYKARRLIISLCVVICISLLLMGLTSSQVTFSDCSIYGTCKPISTISGVIGTGLNGITGNYTILKDANLITLIKTYCSMNFTGGILVSSTC